MRVILIAGGELGDLSGYRRLLRPGDYLLCADSGADRALSLNLVPHRVVGDLDSITASTRRELEERSVEFTTFPCEKDQSDLELALEAALDMHPEEIMIWGALGERCDHTIGNILLLRQAMLRNVKAVILDDKHEIYIINQHLRVSGRPGDIISLFPLCAAAEGVSTRGLKYPLRGETLYLSSTRGLSNEFVENEAEITVAGGELLVIKVKVECRDGSQTPLF